MFLIKMNKKTPQQYTIFRIFLMTIKCMSISELQYCISSWNLCFLDDKHLILILSYAILRYTFDRRQMFTVFKIKTEVRAWY